MRWEKEATKEKAMDRVSNVEWWDISRESARGRGRARARKEEVEKEVVLEGSRVSSVGKLAISRKSAQRQEARAKG